MIELMLAGGKTPVPGGNILKIGTSSTGIGALANSGNLYVIGDLYISGTGGAVKTWTLLAGGVEDFWMAHRQVLMRMKDGRWMFVGSNEMFPTALGSVIQRLTDVSEYMTYPEGLSIKEVSLGFRSLAVVFTDGQYAMCGRNNSGGLGQGNADQVRTLTMRNDFTDVEKIAFDQGSTDTSYLLRKSGHFYVAGSSDYGQAGSISGAVSTWALQSLVTKDFFPGHTGVFMIVDTGSVYATYVQGRHFGGSLGTGSTGDASYRNPTAVWQNISDRSKGVPVIYTGLYSARVTHPVTGVLYYTGTNSGQSQGTGPSQVQRYSFTAMPSSTLQGDYHSMRSNYSVSYLLIDGNLYGTGQDSGGTAGTLPGVGGTRVDTYVPLDTSLVI